MSEKCRFCGYEIHPSYNGRCLTCDTPYEEGKEEGYKSGYKKGVRDMWEAMKLRCDENFFNEENDTTECHELVFEVAENGCEHLECAFETCPIAQKLLKGVK